MATASSRGSGCDHGRSLLPPWGKDPWPQPRPAVDRSALGHGLVCCGCDHGRGLVPLRGRNPRPRPRQPWGRNPRLRPWRMAMPLVPHRSVCPLPTGALVLPFHARGRRRLSCQSRLSSARARASPRRSGVRSRRARAHCNNEQLRELFGRAARGTPTSHRKRRARDGRRVARGSSRASQFFVTLCVFLVVSRSGERGRSF